MLSHLNIRGKDGDQKRDEADPGERSKTWNEHADSAEDFATPADSDDERMRRKPRRHDPHVKRRMQKVVAACRNEEYREQGQGDAPPEVHRICR